MAKKDFSNRQNPVLNPAMRFITAYAPQEEGTEVTESDKTDLTATQQIQDAPKPGAPTSEKKPATRKKRGTSAEKKTRRVNLVMQPSVVEGIDKIATMQRTSVNDLINSILRDYVEREAKTIARFDDVFGQ